MMGKTVCVKTVLLFFGILLVSIIPVVAADGDVMLSDVAAIQEDNTGYIETMSSTINVVAEFDGTKRDLSYDYVMQQDEVGNRKILVTSHGTISSQFMVDTKDNSVTILMGDGSKKRYELTDDQKKLLQQVAGVGAMGGMNDIKSMYASNKKGSVSDVGMRKDLKVEEFETADMKAKIHRDRSNKEHAYVEFVNKDAMKLKDRLQEKMDQANMAQSDTKGGQLLKKRFMDKLKKHGDDMIKYNVIRRMEKINMKTGLVEETEMFNDNGNRLGTMKVKNKIKRRIKFSDKRRKTIEQRLKNRMSEQMAAQAGQEGNTISAAVAVPQEQEIELVTEAETEMDTAMGNSKMMVKMDDIRVNEPVEFKWINITKKSSVK
jgi:hypothetical protein